MQPNTTTQATEGRAPSAPPLLELCNVVKRFQVQDRVVEPLQGASIAVHPGDYISIIGPSGSGKSTLLHILGCLDRPSTGEVLLQGQPVSALDDATLSLFRGRTLGFVFQKFHLLEHMNALHNVRLPLDYQTGVPRRQREARALECLHRVQLSDRAHHRPLQLSGGQQQRVAIARALVNDPGILLLDEPTGNLDPATGEQLMRFIDQLRAESELAVVLVTHDLELASRATRQYLLEDGRLKPLTVAAPNAAREVA